MPQKVAKLDSRDDKVVLWPRLAYNHGAWYTYVRIKRRRKYYLILVQMFSVGSADLLLSAMESLHHAAWKTYHCFYVDAKNPYYESDMRNKNPMYYLDINQEEEIEMLTKYDNRVQT